MGTGEVGAWCLPVRWERTGAAGPRQAVSALTRDGDGMCSGTWPCWGGNFLNPGGMSQDSVRQEDIPAGEAADLPVWGPPREPD